MDHQLRLWYGTLDLLAKIQAERKAKAATFYHFNGKPLMMQSVRSKA